jgi:hypothetical protein
MEEIENRLKETTQACIKSFENWVKQDKNLESREELMEAMHEVRKVVARVEIEIAISERDRLGSRPIPIPPHRSSLKGQNGEEGDDAGFDMSEQPMRHSQNNDGGQRRNNHSRNNRRPMHNNNRPSSGGGNPNPPNDSNGNKGPDGN